jgi:hypothetical protein
VVDADWMNGKKLERFEILGEERNAGDRSLFSVRLHFRSPQESKEVKYVIVGGSPMRVSQQQDYDRGRMWKDSSRGKRAPSDTSMIRGRADRSALLVQNRVFLGWVPHKDPWHGVKGSKEALTRIVQANRSAGTTQLVVETRCLVRLRNRTSSGLVGFYRDSTVRLWVAPLISGRPLAVRAGESENRCPL